LRNLASLGLIGPLLAQTAFHNTWQLLRSSGFLCGSNRTQGVFETDFRKMKIPELSVKIPEIRVLLQ
jgi:hypothetical protein